MDNAEKVEKELKTLSTSELVALWNVCQFSGKILLHVGENNFPMLAQVAKKLLNEKGINPVDGKLLNKA